MAKFLLTLLLSFMFINLVQAKTKTRKEIIKEERLKQHQANIEFRNSQLEKRKAFFAQMDKEEEEYIKSGKKDPNHKKEREKKRRAFNQELKRELEARRKELIKMREARLKK
ncbi:MAG: hypothetical protein U0T83_08975 [Bacteriovoracaceae bacterium]